MASHMVAEESTAVAAASGTRSYTIPSTIADMSKMMPPNNSSDEHLPKRLARAWATENNSAHYAQSTNNSGGDAQQLLKNVVDIFQLAQEGFAGLFEPVAHLQKWDSEMFEEAALSMNKLRDAVDQLEQLRDKITSEARKDMDTREVQTEAQLQANPASTSAKRRQRRQRLQQRWAKQLGI